MRIPFAIHAYQSDSLRLSAQQLVNWYAEKMPPDAKARVAVFPTPGLTSFASAGTGPIRGTHNFNGTLCVVSGGVFYTVDSAGTATSQGNVTGSAESVSMASSATQLMVLSGDTAADAFIWDGTTLAPVTDADFAASTDVTFIDSYFAFARSNSGQWHISDSGDGTSYDALQFATAEGAPDQLVSIEAEHLEMWLFGQRTTEVWYNAGTGTPPFSRITNAFIERGLRAKHSVAKDDNSVFWLGDDEVIYRAEGYVPKRISTHAIEKAMRGYQDTTTATAWSYTRGGHKFYVINFEEATWCFDISTGLWHTRESRDTIGNSLGRWRVDYGVKIYGKDLVGDYSTGDIYALDHEVFTENGTVIRRLATSPPIHNEAEWVFMPKLQIEMEVGVGLTTGQGSDPQIMLRWSDDGGNTWSNEKWRNLGKKGEYKNRVRWTKLGKTRERIFELSITDPVYASIIAADLGAR